MENCIGSKSVVSDALLTFFDIKDYLDIINTVHKSDFKADDTFRKKYNGFYKVQRRSSDWYDLYYSLMEKQMAKPLSFEQLLKEMYNVNKNVEVSFVSKLIATVNPDYPIWDKYVLKNILLENEWEHIKENKECEKKIEKAAKIYSKICCWYTNFLNTDDGQECIRIFDDIFPNYKDKLSNVKKIDYWLWSKRQ